MINVNERRFNLPVVLPCLNTSDGHDSRVIRVVLNEVVSVYIGVVFIVVTGVVREIIIVVLSVGEEQYVFVPNRRAFPARRRWRVTNKLVSRNGRDLLNL